MEESRHIPVLVDEVIDSLKWLKGGIYVDSTLGEGGHAQRILEAILPGGLLIGIDQDVQAVKRARENLKKYKENLLVFERNFSEIGTILESLRIKEVDGILFDLGLSSLQLQDAHRGFSFQKDGPLDMRMSENMKLTAGYLLNTLSVDELVEIISKYGEERWARRIARIVVESRRRRPLETTFELVRIIKNAIPRSAWPIKIHVATRTFQALRIAVNDELTVLEKTLPQAARFLKKGARICIISYHSLEDRIVKNFFREYKKQGLKAVFPKPVTPTRRELQMNPRSRSAKLRAGEMC
ncbi:16S rRNA (cytosine(1402)-N(4))-methyltransferase RsmH [bacterium]|nr:16S rRNA (cytosine(1402)-N(4))-methyltransferase RsmH [bacterium]NIN92383.1 16S rRNA (cytosine(1402)-N(4))-methyltransferase RsmH [bacterium]NIO18497.1 16S rRNA (cytosine(1402)-N(4))-methyltransferase RsmH [bacterium]NIO73493.1 16S rRNA (cytosine(1402)-N(4))-methyltransferase RsmH [bacterium]